MTSKRHPPVSSTLRRATQILEFIAENQPVGATRIQAALGMTKGSVYHVLASLTTLDYVRKEASGYYLSFKLYAMGQTVPKSLDFVEVAKPYMKALAAKEALNVYLSVPDGLRMVGVSHVKPPGPIQVANDFALSYQFHSTASGKLWLASLPPEERQKLYREMNFEKMTETTILTAERLEQEIAQIKVRGYSQEVMEHNAFINGVAAPILDGENTFVASLSAIGPTLVLTSDYIDRVGQIVARTAQEISARLGTGHGTYGFSWPATGGSRS